MKTPNIDNAIMQIRQEIIVKKAGKNTHQNYNYHKGEDVMREVNKHLANHGICYYTQVLDIRELNNKTYYEYSLSISKGDEYKTLTYFVPEDTQQKNAVQAYGSTQTYAERYILQSLLSISDNKDDPDNNKAIKETEYYPQSEVIAVFKKHGKNTTDVQQYFKENNLRSDSIKLGSLDKIVDDYKVWSNNE